MKFEIVEPPRMFAVGPSGLVMSHCADIRLEPDELVTFVSSGERQYDVTRKTWGYYATPSLQSRLSSNGFRAALVKSVRTTFTFVVLIDQMRVEEWNRYRDSEGLQVLVWLS